MRVMISAVLCAAAVARAGTLVQPTVPFTAMQLVAAIAVRGGPDEAALDIEITRLSPDRLMLITRSGRWEIEIGAASGEAAARVVALYVLELAVSGARLASAAPGGIVAAMPLPALRHAPGHAWLSMLGIGARGVRAREFTLVGGRLELSHTGRWVTGAGLALQHGLSIERGPAAPISADLIRTHLVGGVALGGAELVAGGFAGRLIVDGGGGTISHWTTGLVTEVRVHVLVSAQWAFVVAAGGELYRDQIEVRRDDIEVGATPRTTLYVGIGFAWTAGQSR